MSFKTIGISAALATMVVPGLMLANQKFTIAGLDDSKSGEQVNQNVSPSNNQLLAQKNEKQGKDRDKKVPTPALLPGLVALGVGVLRKRKADEVEGADSTEKV